MGKISHDSWLEVHTRGSSPQLVIHRPQCFGRLPTSCAKAALSAGAHRMKSTENRRGSRHTMETCNYTGCIGHFVVIRPVAGSDRIACQTCRTCRIIDARRRSHIACVSYRAGDSVLATCRFSADCQDGRNFQRSFNQLKAYGFHAALRLSDSPVRAQPRGVTDFYARCHT